MKTSWKNHLANDWWKHQRLLHSRDMATMWLHAHNQMIHHVPSWDEWKTPATRMNKHQRNDNYPPRPDTGMDTREEIKQITSPPTSKLPGWTIVITLRFPNKSNYSTDTYYRNAKGIIKIFLCSIYHPHEIEKQKEFLDEIDQFITNRPTNSEIFMVADINLKCWRHVKII